MDFQGSFTTGLGAGGIDRGRIAPALGSSSGGVRSDESGGVNTGATLGAETIRGARSPGEGGSSGGGIACGLTVRTGAGTFGPGIGAVPVSAICRGFGAVLPTMV